MGEAKERAWDRNDWRAIVRQSNGHLPLSGGTFPLSGGTFAPQWGQQGRRCMKGCGGMSWMSEGGQDVALQHCCLNSAGALVIVRRNGVIRSIVLYVFFFFFFFPH